MFSHVRARSRHDYIEAPMLIDGRAKELFDAFGLGNINHNGLSLIADCARGSFGRLSFQISAHNESAVRCQPLGRGFANA